MAIIRNKGFVINDQGEIILETLKNCIKEHQEKIPRLQTLADYYDGKYPIVERQLSDADSPNNKLVVNYAEYISDFASSYFMGNEIDYVGEKIEPIEQAFRQQHIHMVDTELARDLSRFGLGYELIYMSSEDVPYPKSTNIDPRNAFIVVDDTVEYNTILGVHYYPNKDIQNKEKGNIVNVYTKDKHLVYEYDKEFVLVEESQHYFGGVPLIEYWNKANQTADYESVMSLIDAYNVLQSDRVNDKEKFVQALLVVYGVLAGDNSDEKINTVKALKRLGLLEMPIDSKAEYITKSLSENETEILKNSIKNDIHKISKVPDMTDENFAANASGVAMRYKLLGLEQLTKTKEAYYKMSLRERLNLYANVFKVKSYDVDVSEVDIQMTRSLPVNEMEIAQMVMNLKDLISQETLLSQIPFVSDIDAEIERLNIQKEENVLRQQAMFGTQPFKAEEPLEDAQE